MCYVHIFIFVFLDFPALKGFGRPIAWQRDLWNLDTETPDNNGLLNEDLIVWMRTAALPSFRKLYRIVDFNAMSSMAGQLGRGRYTLEIDYSEFIGICQLSENI